MKRIYILFLLLSAALQAQTYTMQDGSFTTCSGTFYDSGGAAGAYSSNETHQITFCPGTPGNYIQLNFSAFDVEGSPFDTMTIYQGPNTSGAIIGTYGGAASPISSCGSGIVASSDPSGCLTIRFVSDNAVEYTGWAATISCTTTPGGSAPTGPPNAVCSGANPFCANAGPLEFPNISNADCVQDAPSVITSNTCLGSVPNPAWYYLEIDNSGNLVLEIKQTTGPGGTGTGLDVDYAIWGPYSSASSACNSFTLGNVVSCSYSVAAIETATIPAAVTGQVYMVLITNFNGAAGYITMTQTNSGVAGAGSTDCTIVCPVAVGTNPTCGGSNGFITISGLDPSTAYTVTYSDDTVPMSVSLTSNASGQVVINGLNAGNYTNILTSFPGCNAAPSSVTLVTGSPPVFNSVTGSSPICAGGNAVFTITGSPNSIVSYKIGSGAIQTVTLNASGTGTVTVSAVTSDTTMTITQISNPATGCTTPVIASKVITVNQLPTASITYSGSPFCTATGATSPVTITGTGAFSGGTFSAPSGLTINASTGAITPSTSTPGNYIVTYTIPASGGCPAVTTTTSVTVTARTTASISYPATSYCTSAPPQPVTLTGTGAYTTGTFSSSPVGLAINSATGTFTPSASSPGTYTVSYVIPAAGGCGNVFAFASSIVIANSATASITYPSDTFCTSQGAQSVTLTGTGAYIGGSYSSAPAGLTIESLSGTIMPSSSLAGNYTVTYTLSAIGSCPPVVVTTSVTIVVSPTVSVAYPANSFCTSAGVQAAILSGTGVFTGGAFTATPAGLTIDSASGNITPSTSAPGNYSVTYTVPSGGPCPPVLAVVPISITAGVTASISYGAASYCKGVAPAPATLTGTGIFTGGVYSASPAGLFINVSTGTIAPSLSTAGTYTVTYAVSGGAGCSPVSALATVTIIDGSTASIGYSSPSFCIASANQNATIGGTGTFTGGTFSSSPAGLVIDSATGMISPSASAIGNYTVTYTIPGVGSCGPVTATSSVAIVSSSTASVSYSSAAFCITDGTQSPNLTGTGSYSGGTYSATPAGLAIDPSTGLITPASSTAGNYTVNYTLAASGACPAVTASTALQIAEPATVTLSYPIIKYCTTAIPKSPILNGTGTYLGGTFSAFPSGLAINSATGLISPATSATGNYVISYTTPSIGGCASVTATANVDITKEPTVTITYAATSYCASSTAENVIITGTGQYTGGAFTADLPGLTINSATGTITPAASVPGFYVVTYTIPSAGGCPSVQSSATVIVDEQPTAAISFPTSGYCTNSGAQTITLTGTGPYSGGVFSASPSGLTIDALTGTITPATSNIGNYTVTYAIPANGSCLAANAVTVVDISAGATASISYPSGSLCTSDSDQTPNLTGTGSYTGGTFSAIPAGLSIDPASGMISPTASAAGNYTITYSAPGTGGCGAVVATADVAIAQASTAAISYPSAGFCTTATAQVVSLTGTGTFLGGTFSASPAGLTIDSVTGTISPSSSLSGIYTVTYVLSNIGACGNVSATTTVNISDASTANIAYPAAGFCTSASDQTVTLTGTGSYSGGMFSVLPAGLAIDPVTGTISPSASLPGNYAITYSALGSGGCTEVDTFANVAISVGATADISYSSLGFCTTSGDQTVTVTGTNAFAGGTFSVSPLGLAIDATTGTISPSASMPGDYSVTYFLAGSGGCGDVSATTTVNISDVSSAQISYPAAAFCTSALDQSVTLTGTGSYSGGTFTVSPVGLSIDASTGTVSPSTSSPGNYIITYSAAGSGGCSGVNAAVNISISAGATAAISYPSLGFCTTAPDQAVTLTGTNGFSGGVFSALPAGLTIDAATGTISPSASAPGNYVVSYSISGIGGCADVSTVTTVNISDVSTAAISYAGAAFCTSASDQQVNLSGTGSYSGGTFSASPSGLTIDSPTGTISPATSLPGNYTITYSALGSGGCSDVSATALISITAPATAMINYPFTSLCTSSASQNVILSGTGTFTGGIFSASPSGLDIDASTGTFSPASSQTGSYMIVYTVSASGACPPVTASIKINIADGPTANIAYSAPGYCTSEQIQPVVITGSAPTGGVFSAQPAGLSIDANTGTINPALSSEGNYTVFYDAAGSPECGQISASTTVAIFGIASASLTYSASGFCNTDGIQPASLTGTGIFAGGVFLSAPSGLVIDPASGSINASASQSGVYLITYMTPSNGSCGPASATANVTITQAATAAIAYSSSGFCTSASGQSVSLNGTGAFSGGTFSASPSGISINANSGLILPSSSAPGTYIVTYSAPGTGSCGPVTASTSVEIIALPTAQIGYSSSSYCTNLSSESAIITGTGAYTGGSFSVSPAGLSINAGTGSIQPESSIPGTYTISYTIAGNAFCGEVIATTTLSIIVPPTVLIGYPSATVCKSELSQAPVLSGTGNYSGGSYSANPAGLSINPASGITNPSASTTGTYTVTYATPTSTGCGSVLATTTIVIYPQPTAVATHVSASICSGETEAVVLEGTVPGTTFSWTVTQNGVDGATGGSGDNFSQILFATGTIPGTVIYTIIPSANGCAGTPLNVTVTVHPIPVAHLDGGNICTDPATGEPTTSFLLNAGLDNSHTFQWFHDSQLIANASSNTYLASLPGNYTVIATSAAGCISLPASASVNAVVTGTEITLNGEIEFADNAHIAVSVNGTGTYEYQIDQGGFASISNFSNLAPGLHTITVRDAEGCTYLTQEFTVIGYPHYFTPNGDGFHDTWNIWSLSEQEFSQIHIFDRYGKLIKVISPNGPGWDGTYNGEPLPSTDYWFTVDYGLPRPYKTFKAHFSLKR